MVAQRAAYVLQDSEFAFALVAVARSFTERYLDAVLLDNHLARRDRDVAKLVSIFGTLRVEARKSSVVRCRILVREAASPLSITVRIKAISYPRTRSGLRRGLRGVSSRTSALRSEAS